MERTRHNVTKYLMLLLCLHFLILWQAESHAATSCAASGVTTIGLEWVADTCLPEGMNDNSTIHFTNTMVECSGSTVALLAPYGDTLGTPTSIINYAKSQGYRVFRNKEGSHIVMVHKYFSGLIDGKSMGGYQTGQVYTDVFKEAFILPTPTPDCKGGDFNLCPFEQKGRSTVNMGTGRLSHTQQLFGTQSTQPLALDLYLNYRSLQFAPSSIGYGWSHSYEMTLVKESNGNRVFWLDGKRRIYTWSGSAYIPPRGDYSTLTQNADSTYTIREKDGTKRNFNSDGSPTSIVDRNGNAVVFAYSSGRLTTVTDPNGRSISFTYDSSGKLSSVTDPGNNTYIFSYANGYLSGLAHPDGGVWQYSYGVNGLLAQKTDPEQNTVKYVYDSDKRVVSTADPAGGVLSYAPPPIATAGKIPDPYPENRLPVKVFVFKEKDDAGWTYTYDTRNERIRTKTDPLGNVTSYTYDASGNVLTETVTGIGTTSYSYDAKGNVLSITDPLGEVTKFTYNGFGEVVATDGAPGKTANVYDTKGNLLSTTDSGGAVTSYTYDDHGNITSVTDPLNKVTALKYDTANNMVSVTLPTTAVTQLSYDWSGNLLSVTDATGGVTRFAYDLRSNLVSSTDPLNNVTSYAYDKNGNRALKTDANSNMTAYKHDFLGQVTNITNALQYAIRFTYGAPGCAACSGTDRLTELVDPKNQKTSWTYDKSGRVISETDPLGKMTAYGYGVGEAPSSKIDANGATIQYSYDALQRLVRKSYLDGATESYTYDSRGNVVTAVNKDVSYTFTYDPGNRIKTVRDNRGYAIDYEYDLGGNRIKMVVQPGMADERVTQYSYDDGGRLAAMITPAGVFAFGYDLANRRTSLSYPNATVASYGYACCREAGNYHPQEPGWCDNGISELHL